VPFDLRGTLASFAGVIQMTREELDELKQHMEETVASICKEVEEILSRNGLLDRIRARMAEKARRLQSQDAPPPSGGDPHPTTNDGE